MLALKLTLLTQKKSLATLFLLSKVTLCLREWILESSSYVAGLIFAVNSYVRSNTVTAAENGTVVYWLNSRHG